MTRLHTTGSRRLLALLVVALLLPLPASAADAQYQRLYLLGNEGKFLYWSFDPTDDHAPVATMVRRCGVANPVPDPCYHGSAEGERFVQFSFNPLSRATSEVRWDEGAPLKFRLQLAVDGVAPTAVQLVAYTGGALSVSAPASQVAPGVWEGTLEDAGAIGPTSNAQFSVRVRYARGAPVNPPLTVTMGMAGASWIELPSPVTGRSLADMRRIAPVPVETSSFRTESRSFRFNDAEWEAFSFEGDLGATREFTVRLSRRAAGVMGVVEMFGEPAVYRALRRGEAAPERLTDAPTTELLRNGVRVASGANSRTEQAGRGSDTVADVDVGAGEITLKVAPAQLSTDLTAAGEDNSYRAYVIVMYGDRTLRSYRASYMPRHSTQTPQFSAGGGGACAHSSELLPLSSAAAAITASMSWDAVTTAQQWTHNYGVPGVAGYPCGESGTGTEIATVLTPAARVLPFGATLARSSVAASVRDVVIHEQFDIVYSP